jgi:hypothetical protein
MAKKSEHRLASMNEGSRGRKVDPSESLKGSGGNKVSGRLKMEYGVEDYFHINEYDNRKVLEQDKELAAGCPHPSARQEEGPSGRVVLGSEQLGVKTEHFNRHREKAHRMR